MKGYKIIYINEKGKEDKTFMGEPMASFKVKKEMETEYMRFVFDMAHPNCKIISLEPCSLSDFEKENNFS